MSHNDRALSPVMRRRLLLLTQSIMTVVFAAVPFVWLAALLFFADADASRRETASLEPATLQATTLRTLADVGGDRGWIFEAGR